MMTEFQDVFPLQKNRVHEACGPGAIGFAAMACGQDDMTVLWLQAGWQSEQLNPVGLMSFMSPKNLTLVQTESHKDLLACTEDGLRSGAVKLVVCELSQDLDLTAGRRLQLAAEEGGSTGILVIPEGAGSNATQTRWHCSPIFGGDHKTDKNLTLQHWRLIKNKSGTLSGWKVFWDAEAHRVIVVSKDGE
ncbi:ImuA family protein [Pseudovibrio denitrificans]|uniref:ImuA family protein n=1 Tax=Pseudovibrio denitrificans TaxID=258256 RepID=UPI0039BFA48F